MQPAVLDALRRAASTTLGDERAAEAMVQTALETAARALARVAEEPLEPMDHQPLPTHD